MPTILRWGTDRVFFYSNERGEPPHVQVRAESKEAKFWLHDLTHTRGSRTHRRKSCSNFEIMPMGIHRPDLDQDLGIAGMLKGRRA